MFRKMIALFVALCLALTLTAALAETAAPVRVGALKGPTAMGMVQMMQDKADAYAFTLAAAPDEMVAALAKGEVDIAAVPANLAAVLYNKIGVKALAVNVLGVLYIAERGDSVHSVADLKGRTLVTAGKGATPEYALNYILRGNGLDPEADLTIEFKSEHAECVAAMMQDDTVVAMLPQPFLTTAMSKAEDLRVALDLTQEWDALQADAEAPSAMITGAIVARGEFAEQNPEAVQQFMADCAESVAFVQQNTDAAAELVGGFDIVPAAVAAKALPFCNIVFVSGEDMHTQLSGYLNELFNQDPAAVGGAVPGEDFYY